MSRKVELPYDVLFMVARHVDDFDTIYSLRHTNSTFAHATEAKFWENLYLTTPRSVTSALLAILKKPSLRRLVRSIRLPDTDDRGDPAEVSNLVSAVDPTDGHACHVLNACFLQWPLKNEFARAGSPWNWTEGMTAAIMTLCPNLETAVVDSDSHRRLGTLRLILQMMKPFTRVTPPNIAHWKVIPDALDYTEGFNSLDFILTGSKRVDLIPYPNGSQFNTPAFPWLRDIEELRMEDNIFEFENRGHDLTTRRSGRSAGRFPGDSALYQDYDDFFQKAAPRLHFLRDSVRRLHWKFDTPLVYPYEEDGATIANHPDDEEFDLWLTQFDEDMQETILQPDGALYIHPSDDDGPEDAWEGQEESETQPPVDETTIHAPEEDERFTMHPSLFFAKEWTRLTHLETTTGAVYGHPAMLFERAAISDMVPLSVEVLVLEERWHTDCQPDPRLLNLYRHDLYWDLCEAVAEGSKLPNLQRVVFVADLGRGYWPGLPERVEWTRGPGDVRDAFREMKRVVDATGGMGPAAKELKLWKEKIIRTMNIVF